MRPFHQIKRLALRPLPAAANVAAGTDYLASHQRSNAAEIDDELLELLGTNR